MEAKRCSQCKKIKPLDLYYRRKASKDGHAPHCKECDKKMCDRWREKNYNRYRTYVREWQDDNPTNTADHKKKYYQTHKYYFRLYFKELGDTEYGKAQRRAMIAVRNALKRGTLIKLPCEICGKKFVHGHHYLGYEPENRLKVKWLCPKHHRLEHLKKDTLPNMYESQAIEEKNRESA